MSSPCAPAPTASPPLRPCSRAVEGGEGAMDGPAERSAELDPAMLAGPHPAASALAAQEAFDGWPDVASAAGPPAG
jgi:hypothetical protein